MEKFKSSNQAWQHPSFYEALTQKMSLDEISSLQSLGKSFFELVECLSQKIFKDRCEDAPLLIITESQLLWEIQVFVNRFIRTSCQSTLRLRIFCQNILQQLEDPSFEKLVYRELLEAYEAYFFTSQIQEDSLV